MNRIRLVKYYFVVGFLFKVLFPGNIVSAQDIHFSQFYFAPAIFNPAMTGFHGSDIRVTLNHKDQWRNLNLYRTSGISYDMKILKSKRKKAHLGFGFFAFRDHVKELNLSSSSFKISLSSIVILNEHQQFSAGIQGGAANRYFDFTEARWGNQYDPIYTDGYNAGLNPGEQIPENKFYGDFSLGIGWNYNKDVSNLSSKDHFKAEAGIAVHHINSPQLNTVNSVDKLYANLTTHAGLDIGLSNTDLSILPGFLYTRQGKAQELNMGLNLGYRLQEASKYSRTFQETTLYLGGYYRIADAIIPSLRIEYAKLALGFSYDINVSGLNKATNGQGGLEIMISYVNQNPFGSASRQQKAKIKFL